MTLSGRFAWLLWVFADIYFLIGFRSRIVVALDWLWAYVTFRRGARDHSRRNRRGGMAQPRPMP